MKSVFYVHVACGLSDNTTKWFDAIVRCLIPFCLMLIGDICITYNIWKSNKMRQDMISEEKSKEDEAELKSLTYMLLAASFTYLFLNLPYIIFIMFAKYTNHFYKTFDEQISANHLWYILSVCFMYLNNSVNFLLYCIGGKTFKKEFLVMCGCYKRTSAREKVLEQAKKDHEERLKEREKRHRMEEKESGELSLAKSKEDVIELCDESISHTVEIHEQPDVYSEESSTHIDIHNTMDKDSCIVITHDAFHNSRDKTQLFEEQDVDTLETECSIHASEVIMTKDNTDQKSTGVKLFEAESVVSIGGIHTPFEENTDAGGNEIKNEDEIEMHVISYKQ